MFELRYSPDQPRDDHGRFGEGEGASLYHGTSTVAAEGIMKDGLKVSQTIRGEGAFATDDKKTALGYAIQRTEEHAEKQGWTKAQLNNATIALVVVKNDSFDAMKKDPFNGSSAYNLFKSKDTVPAESIQRVEYYRFKDVAGKGKDTYYTPVKNSYHGVKPVKVWERSADAADELYICLDPEFLDEDPNDERSLRYSEDQPRDDHGRFGDISGAMPHTVGTQAMFALARVGDKLLKTDGGKYTVKEKGESTLKVYDHSTNEYKEVSKTEVDKELTWGSRSRELRFDFNAADPDSVLCSTVFARGVQPIPSYASFKAAQMWPFEDDDVLVDLQDLVPTQPELWNGKLGTDPEFWEGSTLTVIELEGKLMLWDGHHRAASAILAGQTQLPAHVYVIS